MYSGTVIREFVDKDTQKFHRLNSEYRSKDLKRMNLLAEKGYIVFEAPEESTEEASDREESVEMEHVGGGIYELPNGQRVRGKAAALEALKALQTG